jgi:uncharacterized protein (DUF2342 family)
VTHKNTTNSQDRAIAQVSDISSIVDGLLEIIADLDQRLSEAIAERDEAREELEQERAHRAARP